MSGDSVPQTSATEAAELVRRGAVLLDVREAHELQAARVPEALWIPMSEIQTRAGEVPSEQPVVVMCHSGARSNAVAAFLRAHGMGQVSNMAGGIVAWYRAGLPIEQGAGA